MAVPKGFTHNWTYKGNWKEKKIRPGLWKGRFRATKTRRGARGMGSFGVGTTGAWKIKGTQRIRKIAINKYQTDFRFTKKPMKFNVRRPRRKKRY